MWYGRSCATGCSWWVIAILKSDDVGPVKRRRPAARLPSRSPRFPPRPAGVRPLSLAIEDSSSSVYNHTGPYKTTNRRESSRIDSRRFVVFSSPTALSDSLHNPMSEQAPNPIYPTRQPRIASRKARIRASRIRSGIFAGSGAAAAMARTSTDLAAVKNRRSRAAWGYVRPW